MIASFFIALREGLEAALIVGLTLGVLAKTGRQQYRSAVWSGVVAAVVISLAAAGMLNLLGSNLEGKAEGIFEGITMLLAAGVLTWMIFWMQRHSRRMQQGVESSLRQAAKGGQRWGVFGIAFFAVFREGIEIALFLTATALTTSARQTVIGGLIGLATACLLGWGLFTASVRLDIGRFFQITSVLLILFAAGLIAHGIHEFNEVGWIPAIVAPVWDINHILSEESDFGKMLKALFGYNGNPSLSEMLAYICYYLLIILGIRRLPREDPDG